MTVMRRRTAFVALLLSSVALACSPATPRAGDVAGAGGVRLRYVVEGAGADTLVVLHGGPGLGLESLRPDLAPLARHYALLYFDQRGSGYSGLPDSLALTADAMVEDLEAVRRAFGLRRMTLLGHSWGGGLALLYAMRHPAAVERLVLVGSVPLRGVPWGQRYLAAQAERRDSAENLRMAELDSLIPTAADPHPLCREWQRLFLKGVAASPAHAERIRGDACAGTSENRRAHRLVNRRVFGSVITDTVHGWDWREQARALTMPALVLHGAADPLPLAAAEELAGALPKARLVVLPDAGHYPHAEQPEAFLRAVAEFLAPG